MFVTYLGKVATVIISTYTLLLLMLNYLLQDTSEGTVIHYNYSAVYRKQLSISF